MPTVSFTANTSNLSTSVVNENTQNSSLSPEIQGKHNQRRATPILMARNFMFSSPEGQANYNAVKSLFSFLITLIPLRSEQTSSCESSNAIITEDKYLAAISTYRALQYDECSSLEDRVLKNAVQLVSSNDNFIESLQEVANALTQGDDKATALRFMTLGTDLTKLTDREFHEFIKQEFNDIFFAIAVLFQCSDTIFPKDLSYIDKFKEEFTPENLNLYSKAINIIHMYNYSNSINENPTLNNAQKVKSRHLEFMTSLFIEHNNILKQSSNDETLEVPQIDSNFLKMGVFAFCCELANLPINDHADGQIKYKIYTEVMKGLRQTGDSFPYMKPILRKIDNLISENRNVFSSSTTAPDLSDLYKDIMNLDLKNNKS